MWSVLKQELRPACALFAALTVLTGLLYPSAVTGVAQAVFPFQANGSMLMQGDKPIGSVLIGQHFANDGYFWGRPSGTAPMPYNASASGGANFAASNPAYREAIEARLMSLLKAGMPASISQPVPADLVATSASGLDPEISLAAAQYQALRVAQARHLPVGHVQGLIREHTQQEGLFGLGQARVNVLQLNLALDALNHH
jgi:K+-transporting ATPase ATPase C chain